MGSPLPGSKDGSPGAESTTASTSARSRRSLTLRRTSAFKIAWSTDWKYLRMSHWSAKAASGRRRKRWSRNTAAWVPRPSMQA